MQLHCVFVSRMFCEMACLMPFPFVCCLLLVAIRNTTSLRQCASREKKNYFIFIPLFCCLTAPRVGTIFLWNVQMDGWLVRWLTGWFGCYARVVHLNGVKCGAASQPRQITTYIFVFCSNAANTPLTSSVAGYGLDFQFVWCLGAEKLRNGKEQTQSVFAVCM